MINNEYWTGIALTLFLFLSLSYDRTENKYKISQHYCTDCVNRQSVLFSIPIGWHKILAILWMQYCKYNAKNEVK